LNRRRRCCCFFLWVGGSPSESASEGTWHRFPSASREALVRPMELMVRVSCDITVLNPSLNSQLGRFKCPMLEHLGEGVLGLPRTLSLRRLLVACTSSVTVGVLPCSGMSGDRRGTRGDVRLREYFEQGDWGGVGAEGRSLVVAEDIRMRRSARATLMSERSPRSSSPNEAVLRSVVEPEPEPEPGIAALSSRDTSSAEADQARSRPPIRWLR